MYLTLNIQNETDPLKSVVLGIAEDQGPPPALEQAYDPNSLMHLKAGTYPKEADMIAEMENLAEVFKKHGVTVYRPELIPGCNQIFARDIAFVVDDLWVLSNILPDRAEETNAIQYLIDQADPQSIVIPPEQVHVEGGDVMPWNEYLFVGVYAQPDYKKKITARTNAAAVDFLTELFPHKKVKAFALEKSNTDPYANALHLDCCFQPIGRDMALIYPPGFTHPEDVAWISSFFGPDRIFEITRDELVMMGCNVFSISPSVVVSESRLVRINTWMREMGLEVEEVSYQEIAKQGGMLRCSTLPLNRAQ
jgi:N-dimethylarginine dimethylaminohydrolase